MICQLVLVTVKLQAARWRSCLQLVNTTVGARSAAYTRLKASDKCDFSRDSIWLQIQGLAVVFSTQSILTTRLLCFEVYGQKQIT